MELYEMQKKLGDISQIAGVRELVWNSGKGKGTSVFEIYNAAGLRFSILPDKCMDLWDISYKGTNLSFVSKNGLVGNRFFNALDNEFIYYWSGGALATCGLASAGPACVDEGLYRPTHGRIGMTPAENVCAGGEWADGDYRISCSGEMRESMLYGMHMKLTRKISTALYGKEIRIQDTVENMEPKEEPYFILYHFNFGFPLLDAGARIVRPEGIVRPRNEDAARGIGEWHIMTDPADNAPEQVFFHDIPRDAEGYSVIGIVNDALKLGVYLKFTKDLLPVLAEWKSMRSHDYALGLEPCNHYIRGRREEREKGAPAVLKGYGRARTELRLGILEGEAEITAFQQACELLKEKTKQD
jgi:hypothetical protein